jgi:hypothetical protein
MKDGKNGKEEGQEEEEINNLNFELLPFFSFLFFKFRILFNLIY